MHTLLMNNALDTYAIDAAHPFSFISCAIRAAGLPVSPEASLRVQADMLAAELADPLAAPRKLLADALERLAAQPWRWRRGLPRKEAP